MSDSEDYSYDPEDIEDIEDIEEEDDENDDDVGIDDIDDDEAVGSLSSISEISEISDDEDDQDYEEDDNSVEQEYVQPKPTLTITPSITPVVKPSASIQKINASAPTISKPVISIKPASKPTIMVKPPTQIAAAPPAQVVAKQIQQTTLPIEQMAPEQLAKQQVGESDDMFNYRRRYAAWIKKFYPELKDYDIQVLAYKAGQNAFLNVTYDTPTMNNINTVNEAIKKYSS